MLEVRSPLYARRYGTAEQITVLDISPDDREAGRNEPDSLPEAAGHCSTPGPPAASARAARRW